MMMFSTDLRHHLHTDSQQHTSDIPGRYYGFSSFASNPQATPLTFVSSCSGYCTDKIRILPLPVEGNGSLELVGNCVNGLGEIQVPFSEDSTEETPRSRSRRMRQSVFVLGSFVS
eukprot:scaffold3297_cov132-Cylindrotheca_fusiformis.AAC.8